MKKEFIKKGPKIENKETVIIKTNDEKNKTNNVVFGKETKKIIRIIAMILAYGAAVISLFTFIFAIITVLKIVNSTKLDLLLDNFSLTFISNMNGITNSEVIGIISEYGNNTAFIIFNVIIPAIAIVSSMIILIIAIKEILDFVAKVSREKDLYTKARLIDVERIACLIETIITIHFVVFNRPSILLFLLVSLMFFIIIGLFAKCVSNEEK